MLVDSRKWMSLKWLETVWSLVPHGFHTEVNYDDVCKQNESKKGAWNCLPNSKTGSNSNRSNDNQSTNIASRKEVHHYHHHLHSNSQCLTKLYSQTQKAKHALQLARQVHWGSQTPSKELQIPYSALAKKNGHPLLLLIFICSPDRERPIHSLEGCLSKGKLEATYKDTHIYKVSVKSWPDTPGAIVEVHHSDHIDNYVIIINSKRIMMRKCKCATSSNLIKKDAPAQTPRNRTLESLFGSGSKAW